MNVGMRHRPAPVVGRRLALFLSVMALLALLCVPALAHAEDSSGVQYSDAIPKVEGENTPTQKKKPQPIAKAADNGGAAAPERSGDGSDASEPGNGSSEEDSSSSGGVAKDRDGGTGQGSPGGSASGKAEGKVQPPAHGGGEATAQKSDGGSSPLVPILVAILVLAAISVGVVMLKQRRQRSGPTASAPSPKAS
jgi:cobalamin biosynthesis Mg chelatase CobN